MSMKLFDDDGYPSEDALKSLRCNSTDLKHVDSWLEFAKSLWMYPEAFREHTLKDGTRIISISTLGWSGNEDVIDAMQSHVFWTLFWHSSIRGGHFQLRINKYE